MTKGAGIDPLSAGVAEDANDPDRTAAPKSSPRNLRLVVAGGPSPLAIELAAPGVWTFGRADDVDVKIDDPSISRHHARLIVELDRSHVPQLFIEDLGSSNGTSVRGRRIERGARTALSPGEAIDLGDVLAVIQGSGGSTVDSWVTEGPVIKDPAMREL